MVAFALVSSFDGHCLYLVVFFAYGRVRRLGNNNKTYPCAVSVPGLPRRTVETVFKRAILSLKEDAS